jgi:hypothetical protein
MMSASDDKKIDAIRKIFKLFDHRCTDFEQRIFDGPDEERPAYRERARHSFRKDALEEIRDIVL